MNFGLHIGNILYLSAYLVRDILWLRILTVVGTLSLIQYYYFDCADMRGAILWCSLFTLVNLVQIAMLVMERRPVFLGEDELQLYRMVFQSLSPREFMKLISAAEWKSAPQGEVLLRQDQQVEQLAIVAQGCGDVQVDGRHVAQVTPGQFCGEMGFLTGQPASASVVASLPVNYLAWPVERLQKLFQSNPQLHVKFQGILGVDLVEKLRQEGFAAAHPSQVMGTYEKPAED